MSHRAVFLDRDGTINREVDYLSDPTQFELLPGAGAALARLAAAGFALVVVTNQSGIARGLLDPAILERVHERMRAELGRCGVQLAAIESCPHHPEHGQAPWRARCDCRKPAPGMLLRAAQRLDLDLAASWTIGDSLRDLEAGRAAGTRVLLVRTGKGRTEEASCPPGTPVFDDLTGAAEHILSQDSRTPG